MKLAVVSDHAGFELKEIVRTLLREMRHEVIDLGTHDRTHVDYPDFADAAGKAILDGRA